MAAEEEQKPNPRKAKPTAAGAAVTWGRVDRALSAGAGLGEVLLAQPCGSAPATHNQPRECSQTLGANTQRGGAVHLSSPSLSIFWS